MFHVSAICRTGDGVFPPLRVFPADASQAAQALMVAALGVVSTGDPESAEAQRFIGRARGIAEGVAQGTVVGAVLRLGDWDVSVTTRDPRALN